MWHSAAVPRISWLAVGILQVHLHNLMPILGRCDVSALAEELRDGVQVRNGWSYLDVAGAGAVNETCMTPKCDFTPSRSDGLNVEL
jgi:hypothetical protein